MTIPRPSIRPVEPGSWRPRLLLAASPASHAGTPINKRAAADPTGSVEVSNVSGTVTVTGWDRNEVEVTGELGEGTERLEFTTPTR